MRLSYIIYSFTWINHYNGDPNLII